jgi:hypothetical protein
VRESDREIESEGRTLNSEKLLHKRENRRNVFSLVAAAAVSAFAGAFGRSEQASAHGTEHVDSADALDPAIHGNNTYPGPFNGHSPGILGTSAVGVGVWGQSGSGAGVAASSETGTGVETRSNGAYALSADGQGKAPALRKVGWASGHLGGRSALGGARSQHRPPWGNGGRRCRHRCGGVG